MRRDGDDGFDARKHAMPLECAGAAAGCADAIIFMPLLMTIYDDELPSCAKESA